MNIANNIYHSTQNRYDKRNCLHFPTPELIDFPNDELMREVIRQMPKETKKQILLNVYDRYRKEFDF